MPSNKYIVQLGEPFNPFIYYDQVNLQSPTQSQEFYNGIKNKLPENILTKNPKDNYTIWNDDEIDVLEDYRDQFAFLKNQYVGNEFFMQNWINCDKSIIYYYDNIHTQYKNFDESITMKESIRLGTALKANIEITDEMRVWVTEMNEKILNQHILLKLKSNECIHISMDKYISLKRHIDVEIRNAILNNKKLIKLYK